MMSGVAILVAQLRDGRSRRAVSERASQRAFFAVLALIFAASVAATIVRCASMAAMGEMPMPGGWTMSTAWLPMCGQTWAGVAAAFLGMWVVIVRHRHFAIPPPTITPPANRCF
jgi:hypothetical protein